ncbi:hypothetical protein PHMEG_0003920 [Phytophthora megakarya]|uniref:Uncharacterized protein n=1 Tax=Phytophthora megakarya TaxID=4795 RepID=A0A225WV88_9STRA|nr:hypothetical protein PHMEG_0003920 [Phytophthora megakarya]
MVAISTANRNAKNWIEDMKWLEQDWTKVKVSFVGLFDREVDYSKGSNSVLAYQFPAQRTPDTCLLGTNGGAFVPSKVLE